MRSVLNSVVLTMVALASLATLALAAGSPACSGQDVMAELATREPEVHRAILDRAAQIPNADALLWKVEKPGKPPSHLFGTVHLTDPRVTALSPAARAALDGATRVALEIADMTVEAMQSAMAGSATLLIAPKGNGLERHLSPDELKLLKSTLVTAGLPDQFAGLIRPWVVTMLRSVSECERARVAGGIRIVDMQIGDIARKNGAAVIGLETMQSQLAALARVSEPQQIELLKMSLKLDARRDDMMETMVQLYTRRQMGVAWPLAEALAEKAGTSAAAYRSFETELLTKRNIKMRDSALPLVAQGRAFIAVGALHLQGETGLVELLRRAGYTVTAVDRPDR